MLPQALTDRKSVGTHGIYGHNGDLECYNLPELEWEQSETYDARITGNDRYLCQAGPSPSYLQVTCQGNRVSE